MIEFRDDLLNNKELAVSCNTKEECVNLLSWAHKNNTGKILQIDDWDRYKTDTYMRIAGGGYGKVSNLNEKYSLLSYEEALLNKPEEKTLILTQDNIVPDIHITNAGEHDSDKLFFFVRDLLELNYRVTVEVVGALYELKGYKRREII